MAGFGYHLRQAIGCLRHSPWAATMAAGTVAVSLSVCGAALVAARSVESALTGTAADARVTIFLPPGTDEAQGSAWAKEAAAAAGGGAIATFVPPDQALSELAGELGEAGDALRALAINPLPPTIDVRLAPARLATGGVPEVRAAAARVSALAFAGDLDWGEGFVTRLESLLLTLRAAGLVVLAGVVGLMLFLVGNVVRLTVYARRDEIEILRLVGATDGFIATPFVLEGALQGLAGGVASIALVAGFERWALPWLAGTVGFGPSLMAPPLGTSLLLLPLLGLVAGVVASLTSTLRFLRASS